MSENMDRTVRPEDNEAVVDAVESQQLSPDPLAENPQGPRDFREHVEMVLSSGGEVNPRELAVAQGVATVEEADGMSTVGMTLPSVSTEAGVAADGTVFDRRHDVAMRERRVLLGEEEPGDDFELVPGVSVARAAAASRGVPANEDEVDNRRVVLVDTQSVTGSTLSAATVLTEDSEAEEEEAAVSEAETKA